MASTVARMSDPDQSLVLKKTVKDRLLRQRKAVASGQRGESLAVIVKRLGLTNNMYRVCLCDE
jgi:hypothetical protein